MYYLQYGRNGNVYISSVKSSEDLEQSEDIMFVEGGFETLQEVDTRLNQMNIPESLRIRIK